MKRALYPVFWTLPYEMRQVVWRVLRPGRFRQAHEQRRWEINRHASLQPFDRHRCIFVAIPKTAGTSIARSLFGHGVGLHRTLREYALIFSQAEFREYFKFTVVRNPWDRLYSAFSYLKAGGGNQLDRQWAEDNLAKIKNFEAFVTKWLPHADLDCSYIHLVPQYQYLRLRDESPAVDFIGRFETLQEDFEIIRSRLGIDAELLHMRPSRRSADYREVYTDEMKAIVARAYCKDIELLGYEFESWRGQATLAHLL